MTIIMGDPKPFGLRDIKFTNLAGTLQVDLPSSQVLSFTPRLSSGELMGDDAITSIVAYPIAFDWSLENGGIPMNAWAIATGIAASTAGSTPNQITTQTWNAGAVFPYFKIYGKAVSEELDDVHVLLFKCKLTSPPEGQFSQETFYVASMSGVAIDDGVNGVIDIIHNETAANLPTS